MALMRQSPWLALNQLHEEMGRLFERSLVPETEIGASSVADWIPAVDIGEERDRFVLRADLPAVDPKDISVAMEKGVLTISGDRKYEGLGEGDTFKRIERPTGAFYRRFVLPDTADGEHVSAHDANGVLEVIIPKYERAQPRRIAVEA